MALNFPPSAAKPEFVKRGAGDFFFGSYVAAGADTADLRHMGPTQGGVEFDFKKTLHEIEVDQFLDEIVKELEHMEQENKLLELRNQMLLDRMARDGVSLSEEDKK